MSYFLLIYFLVYLFVSATLLSIPGNPVHEPFLSFPYISFPACRISARSCVLGIKKDLSFERSCKKGNTRCAFPSLCFLFSLPILSYYIKKHAVQVVLGRFTSRLFFRRAGFRHVSVQLFSGVPDFGTFPYSYFPACRISARFRAVIFRRAGFRHAHVQRAQLYPLFT